VTEFFNFTGRRTGCLRFCGVEPVEERVSSGLFFCFLVMWPRIMMTNFLTTCLPSGLQRRGRHVGHRSTSFHECVHKWRSIDQEINGHMNEHW